MTERDIFLAVIDLPDPESRAEYLNKACGADVALCGGVESLLRSHQEAGSFLGTPVVVPPDPDHAHTRAFTPTPDPREESSLARIASRHGSQSLGRPMRAVGSGPAGEKWTQ